MTSDTSSLAGMGAEAGFEDPEEVSPIRVSGFFSLLFGLISGFAFMGLPMLVFPLLAISLGFLTLRKCDGKIPLGTTAAKIGLVLGVGFGVFGFLLPWMKVQTMRAEAEQFSLEYLRLVGSGNEMLARELAKEYRRRLPPTMPLFDYYTKNPDGRKHLQVFHLTPLNRDLRSWGPNVDWKLDRPIVVDNHYGREQVDVVWRGPPGTERIQFFLMFQFDSNGVGQWHVDTVQYFRERVVAKRVL